MARSDWQAASQKLILSCKPEKPDLPAAVGFRRHPQEQRKGASPMKGKEHLEKLPASSEDLLYTLSDGWPVSSPVLAKDGSAAQQSPWVLLQPPQRKRPFLGKVWDV